MRITILGAPGSGKTTLAKNLGDIFKSVCMFYEYMAKEHYCIDYDSAPLEENFTNEDLVLNNINKVFEESNNFIFDGFPRKVEHLEKSKVEIDFAIYLIFFNDQNRTDRMLKRGLDYDTIDFISKRNKEHDETILPILKYFADNDKLIPLKADKPIIDLIAQAIIQMDDYLIEEAVLKVNRLQKTYKKYKENLA